MKATPKTNTQHLVRRFLKIGLLVAAAAVASLTASPAHAVTYSLTIDSARSKDVGALEGSPVTFSVFAYCSPSTRLYYQWYYHSQQITGATSSSYTIPAAKYADVLGGSGLYACNVSTSPVFSSYSGNQSKMSDWIMLSVSKVSPPRITTQPQSITVTKGGSATLRVSLSDTSGVSYQWKRNGINVGVNSNVLSIPSAQPSDQGVYTVVATNKGGAVTSSSANLTVKTSVLPVNIVTQPISLSVLVGQAANLSVGVSDETGTTYQWKRNGVSISGATSKTFSIVASRLTDAGTYTVTVSNPAATVTSNAVTLTVKAAATVSIVKQPSSLNVEVGQKAEFTVTPSFESGVTYQWEKDGISISGAKSKTFSIASVKTTDKGIYTVVVCDAAGCVTSLGATLGVSSPTGSTVSGWTENFTEAKARAATLKRPLLLDFTGSDWCGYCIKLDNEVFSKPEFKLLGDKNLVLVKVDFPHALPQTAAIKSQNQGLQATYGVRGLPTLVLLDSSGKEVTRWVGYRAEFLAELKKQIGVN